MQLAVSQFVGLVTGTTCPHVHEPYHRDRGAEPCRIAINAQGDLGQPPQRMCSPPKTDATSDAALQATRQMRTRRPPLHPDRVCAISCCCITDGVPVSLTGRVDNCACARARRRITDRVRQLPLPHRSPGAVVDPAGHRRVQDQPWLLSRPITAADAPAPGAASPTACASASSPTSTTPRVRQPRPPRRSLYVRKPGGWVDDGGCAGPSCRVSDGVRAGSAAESVTPWGHRCRVNHHVCFGPAPTSVTACVCRPRLPRDDSEVRTMAGVVSLANMQRLARGRVGTLSPLPIRPSGTLLAACVRVIRSRRGGRSRRRLASASRRGRPAERQRGRRTRASAVHLRRFFSQTNIRAAPAMHLSSDFFTDAKGATGPGALRCGRAG
jgi:hypothetical protein